MDLGSYFYYAVSRFNILFSNDILTWFYLIKANYMCSDHWGTGSVFSGDKTFDEPAWGTFDTNDDVDSVWGFNASSSTKVSEYFQLFFLNTYLTLILLRNIVLQSLCMHFQSIHFLTAFNHVWLWLSASFLFFIFIFMVFYLKHFL